MTDVRQSASALRFIAGLVLATIVTACAGSDVPKTVWDFRDPVTGFDLGGASADFASFDEQDEMLLVILPTGERLELAAGVDAYRSNFFGDNPAPGALDQVLYAIAPPGDVEELRVRVADFTDRWGEALGQAEGAQTATEYVAELNDDIDEDGDPGSPVKFFESVTSAGEVAKLGIGTTGGGQWSASVTLSFRPPPADA